MLRQDHSLSPLCLYVVEMGKALGSFRVSYLVALCCSGSFLFAYDTGVVGGVLTLASFERDFRYTKAEQVDISSNATSLLQAGGTFPDLRPPISDS